MKVLYIGGTGNISIASTQLAVQQGIEMFVLNRGNRLESFPNGVKSIKADIANMEAVKAAIADHTFDVVVNWIAFTPADIRRDYELFKDKTKQYVFISSASAYQKPVSHPVITESTPLINPYWDYSRNKIACEELLNSLYRKNHFPVTIVRPSLTYNTVIPVAIGGWTEYTIVDRIRKGKKIIIHGDGTSLWTITHADDFAKGFNGLLGHQQAIGHAFHITSDEILTWNQIYEALVEAIGVKAQFVHIPSEFICKVADKMGIAWMRGNLLGDKSNSVIFDNSKIKSFVPGFTATIPFKQGIKRTIEWFEAEPNRMIVSKETNQFMDSVINTYWNVYNKL